MSVGGYKNYGLFKGAATLDRTTLGITTLGITTLAAITTMSGLSYKTILMIVSDDLK